MTLGGQRSYLGSFAALCLTLTALASYANADDTAVITKPAPVEKTTSSNASAKKTATTATEKTVAKAPNAAVKAAKLKPAAGKKKVSVPQTTIDEDDDGFDDRYGTYYDDDPFEPLNRAIFSFNRTVDEFLLRPVTVAYRGVVPERGRLAVTHFLQNLYLPVTFANSVFQADGYNTMATFWRFVINSTFGLGGLFDAASEVGLTPRVTDMGQTFAIYGADTGPYIVMPFAGPANVRDAIGQIGDIFLFPPNYAEEWAIPLGIGAVTAMDARSNNMELIDSLYESSLDPYATFRSAFTQRRAEAVRRAKRARNASVAAD